MKIEVNFIIDSEDLLRLKSFLGDTITITEKQVGCSVEGCEFGHHAKGYCQPHYRKWKAYGDPLHETIIKDRGCLTEGCTGLHYAKGYCYNCYMNFRNPVLNTKYERKEWNRIKSICSDPSHGLYPRYGGRGVTVCDQWQSFDAFYADMGAQPSAGAIVDGESFEPGSCAWKTPEQFQEDNLKRASERMRG